VHAFAELYRELDQSNRTNDKLEALVRYFSQAPAEDAAWCLWFYLGGKLQLRISSRRILEWAGTIAAYPDWLAAQCYERVGDLAETAALLLSTREGTPGGGVSEVSLSELIEQQLLPLRHWDAGFQFPMVRRIWSELTPSQCLVVNKLLTGGFRVGVSRQLVIRALSEALGLERSILTHRLMGEWEPTGDFFRSLSSAEANAEALRLRPYPFYLASPLEKSPDTLGPVEDWFVEWKWDGIRAQLLVREEGLELWSRGDERLNESFPEILRGAASLPQGTVLDGEILCWEGDNPRPFHHLQRRLGRTDPDQALLEAFPCTFLAYDCLEVNATDLRSAPMVQRRASLESLLPTETPHLRLSPLLKPSTWEVCADLRLESRERDVEGLMLKVRSGTYKTGRVRGEWWKWKADPYSVDLVMIYAQAGHGRRAGLYTDYTLAAWEGDQLLPVAKAYSGLTDEEMRAVDRWIKQNTLARRGPVRTVPAVQVFEIGFEGLQPSTRHKSGVAMRFPRILRWRKDKLPEQADTLDNLKAFLKGMPGD
jgi:DNA ligase-1